ncbi:MAG TPA: Ig-like domain repeat protein, partial [Propionicimonas sp.]
AAGGTYSMGIAYMTNNDLTVVKAYYTTINVDAGTGTWKFATYVPPVVTATTTKLSADKASLTVGGSVALTATVTPSAAAGSVEFFDGTTSLGTSVVSLGTATRTATVASVGSHSYKAAYSPSSGSYSASTSSVVTVTSIAGKTFTKTHVPTISGTSRVGKKLTAKTKAWSPVATFTYQWYANGTPITGATRSAWKLDKSQKGRKITVKVTGSRTDYASVSITSRATAKVRK